MIKLVPSFTNYMITNWGRRKKLMPKWMNHCYHTSEEVGQLLLLMIFIVLAHLVAVGQFLLLFQPSATLLCAPKPYGIFLGFLFISKQTFHVRWTKLDIQQN